MTNIEKVLSFFAEKPGHLKTARKDLAARLNVSTTDIDEAKKQLRENSPSVTDIEEFANEQGFDLSNAKQIWYKNKNLSVRVDNQKQELDEQRLYNFLSNYKFEQPLVTHNTYNNNVSVINMTDAHIDKLGYNALGGLEEIKKNLDILFYNFNELLLDVVSEKPETIIFPIGNDFFNTNASFPTTKAGTFQPYTTHWQDVFELGVEFYRKCIDTISKYSKVHVVSIPGNHDEDKVFHLAQVLKAVYENNNNVFLNFSKDHRKYEFFNDVLFGFGHGKTEKRRMKDLPTAMALEQPELWSKAKHRIWILGDIHHKEQYQVLKSLEHNGVDIVFLRASCGNDVWHKNSMWIGAKKSLSSITYINGGKKIINNELFF